MGDLIRSMVQKHDNPDYVTVHFDRALPSLRYDFGRVTTSCVDSKPPEGDELALADELVAIEGVESFTMSGGGRYQCSVTKGRVFGWGEVLPGLIAAVEAYLTGRDGLVGTVVRDEAAAFHGGLPPDDAERFGPV